MVSVYFNKLQNVWNNSSQRSISIQNEFYLIHSYISISLINIYPNQ